MITFDIETRQFANSNGGFLNHLNKHSGKYVAGATALAGGFVGSKLAKKKAIEEAERYGYQPGTPEYKAIMRKHQVKGALIGGASGAALGWVGNAGVKGLVAKKQITKQAHDHLAVKAIDKANKIAEAKKTEKVTGVDDLTGKAYEQIKKDSKAMGNRVGWSIFKNNILGKG